MENGRICHVGEYSIGKILYIKKGEIMSFFEGKIELYNILFFFIIPVGIPIMVLFAKQKLLWFSPLATITIGLILTAVFYPYFFTDLFNGNNEIGGGGTWFFFAVPIHLVITIVTVAILYGIKRRTPEAKSINQVMMDCNYK